MANEQFAHLEIARLLPAPPRRKKGGGGRPLKKSDDVWGHGDAIAQQLEATRALVAQNKPIQFDPGLMVKLTVQAGTLSDEALRSFGIEVISEESDETLVVFVSEDARREFLRRLELYKLGGSGRGVSANVFHAIEQIAMWQRSDRIGATLSSRQWNPDEQLVVDVELWPRESVAANRILREQTVEWLQASEADIWDSIAVESVILVRASIAGRVLDALLELESVRVVDTPPELRLETTAFEFGLQDLTIEPAQEHATRIAVLDSGVVSGHPVLSPHIGEAHSFLPGKDGIDETGHGTAVASFALYGDLEKCVLDQRFGTPLILLSGKVLSGTANEYDRRLIASQILDAVTYFHGQLGCRIFNISFADRNQPYDGTHVRGLAAFLDELARQRGVLFVLSAGNFSGTDTVPNDWRADYPNYLFMAEARIIDPAPALNALTVGSLARYDQDRHAGRYPRDPSYQPIARVDQLSPFTRTGPGPGGAIKPDVVDYGGNVSVDIRRGKDLVAGAIDPSISEIAAKHDFAGERLFAPVIGTSFAAPKVANLAARVLAVYPNSSANLLRALVVLSAKWPEGAEEHLEGTGEESFRQACMGYGYGRPQVSKALYSSENRVALVAEETIEADQTHFFEIPLPEDFLELCGSHRSIRVALAHSPICRSTRLSYKGTKISFKVVAEDSVETLAARFHAGSKLKNVDEWGGFRPGAQLRSRGTVMMAEAHIDRLTRSSQIVRGKRLFVVVTRQVEGWAAELAERLEPYALAVSIEDTDREHVRFYTQLRARVRERARARVGV